MEGFSFRLAEKPEAQPDKYSMSPTSKYAQCYPCAEDDGINKMAAFICQNCDKALCKRHKMVRLLLVEYEKHSNHSTP